MAQPEEHHPTEGEETIGESNDATLDINVVETQIADEDTPRKKTKRHGVKNRQVFRWSLEGKLLLSIVRQVTAFESVVWKRVMLIEIILCSCCRFPRNAGKTSLMHSINSSHRSAVNCVRRASFAQSKHLE